jgi:hypothetical protein
VTDAYAWSLLKAITGWEPNDQFVSACIANQTDQPDQQIVLFKPAADQGFETLPDESSREFGGAPMMFIFSLILNVVTDPSSSIPQFHALDSTSCRKFALKNGYWFRRVDFWLKSFILAINSRYPILVRNAIRN